ncbi:TetR/AcrR family transcriptional regulator [Spirillospora sp. NBC_01491]|uniref:TetR/AcrR family transcriptional regulator n=1 Tax=Spirillospora sp. NBC_01491 TaxID=2976007 RepID=UPI002E301174|nr:TetR/AcrR family transcriptional regulator [Spirillospora sp. NBC_01491]
MTPRRQEDRTRATRTALIAAARELFGERGYAAVPAEEIVAGPGLTRGAMRHHFGDKRALFAAVFEELQAEIAERVAAAAKGPDRDAGTWDALRGGLVAFLDLCREPEVIRIALTDAPAVLGWQACREVEARHGLGLVTAGLDRAGREGIIAPRPAGVLARLLLGAAVETALIIARAPDPAAAREPAERTLLALLDGLRTAPGGMAPGRTAPEPPQEWTGPPPVR